MTISAEEYHAVSTAIRDPSFPTLFRDFLEEIADPKNRAETIQYYKDLETRNEIPSGKRLIWPEPWICVEARHVLVGPHSSANRGQIYLNLVLTDHLGCLETDSKTGEVRLPMVVSQPRLDKRQDAICVTCDILLGTQTVKFGDKYLTVIVEIIIDELNKTHFRKEYISYDFRIRRDWKYKDGISKSDIIPIIISSVDVHETIETCDASHHSLKNVERIESTKIEPELSKCSYRLVESFSAPAIDFLESSQDSRLPEALKLSVVLPGIISAGQISTTMEGNSVNVTAGEHSIEVKLSYKVDIHSARARFDVSKSLLEIDYKILGKLSV